MKTSTEAVAGRENIQKTSWLETIYHGKAPKAFLGTKDRWELFSFNLLKGRNSFEYIDIEDAVENKINFSKYSFIVADYTHIENKELIAKLIEIKYYNVPVVSPIEFFETYKSIIPVDFLSDLNFLNLEKSPVVNNSFYQFFKRMFDVLISTILLVLSIPLYPLLLFVWIDSKASPIYVQKRLGLNKKEFNIYKLRTMKKDAESSGAQWAQKADPRITRLGKFLRKWRVDEIPQLINVLKGEMSLIGPRPERKIFSDILEEEVPYFGLRNAVKPGISGWAQVTHVYSACVQTSKEKLGYDLFYIKNSSFHLEMKIFIKTVFVMLLGKGM